MTIKFEVFYIPVFFRRGAAVSQFEEVQQQNIARASTHGKSGKPTQWIESNTSRGMKRLPYTSMFENSFVPWGKVTDVNMYTEPPLEPCSGGWRNGWCNVFPVWCGTL